MRVLASPSKTTIRLRLIGNSAVNPVRSKDTECPKWSQKVRRSAREIEVWNVNF